MKNSLINQSVDNWECIFVLDKGADIATEKLHILSNGKVEGDLVYKTLKIDEGGYLNSSKVIKMSDQSNLNSKSLKN